MKNSPSYTSELFGQITVCDGDTVPTGTNALIILTADPLKDRRIYELTVYNTNFYSEATHPIEFTIWVTPNAFSLGGGYRLFSYKISDDKVVNLTKIDHSSSIFQKKKDTNGSYYFDLPKGWSLGIAKARTSSELMCNTYVSGEKQ